MLPFRAHPALHGEGLPHYVLDWFDHDRARRILVFARRQPIARPHPRSRAAHFRLVRHVSAAAASTAFSRLTKRAGSDARARKSISDRRALGAHSLGRSHRRRGFWPRGAARYGRDSAALVQSLAEGFGRIRQRAAHPPLRAGRKSLAQGRRLARAARNTRFYLHSDGRANSRKGDGVLSAAPPRVDEPRDIFVYDPEVPVLAPGGPAAASGQFDQAALELGNNLLVYTTEPLAEPLRIFGTPRVVALLRHFRGAHRLHRQARAREAQRRGGIHLHRHRALELAFRRSAVTPRTKFITGSSISSPLPAASPPATAFAWKSPAARFRSTTAIPAAACPPRRATSWDWRRSTQIRLSRQRASLRAVSAGERGAPDEREPSRAADRIRRRQQALRQRPAWCCERIDLTIRKGRIRQPHRPFRLRQIHDPEIDFRADAADAAARSASTA